MVSIVVIIAAKVDLLNDFLFVWVVKADEDEDSFSSIGKNVFTMRINVFPVSTTNPRITNTVTIPTIDTKIAVLIDSPIEVKVLSVSFTKIVNHSSLAFFI